MTNFAFMGLAYKILFVLIFLSASLFAQMPLDTIPSGLEENLTEKNFEKKIDFDLSAGTSYSFLGKYGSFSNVYFAPGWRYKLSPRFSLKAGAIINYTPYTSVPTNFFKNGENASISNPPVGLMLYTEGSYLLSSRLTITGMAYKEVLPAYRPYLNQNYSNYKMQGVSIGFNYKVFENLHIGAQFNYSDTPSSLFYNNTNQSVIDNFFW